MQGPTNIRKDKTNGKYKTFLSCFSNSNVDSLGEIKNL